MESKAKTSRRLDTRQTLTTLGILLLTFGAFGWQWRAFSQRAENQHSETVEESPPPNTHWHEAPKEVRVAVAKTVRGQLTAFKGGDFESALQHHTLHVRRNVGTIQDYQQLVQTQYPPIAQHKRATFWLVNVDKKRNFANAGLTVWGADKRSQEVVYQLAFQNEEWLISGISKVPASHSLKTKKSSIR